MEMKDVDYEEEDEDEVVSELDPDEGLLFCAYYPPFEFWRAKTESSEEETGDEDASNPFLEIVIHSSVLTVGYKGDRSYVVHGNNIGVFNHTSDNSVKYYVTIGNIATPKGKKFKPKHACLSIRWLFGEIDWYSINMLCYMIKILRWSFKTLPNQILSLAWTSTHLKWLDDQQLQTHTTGSHM